MQAALYALFVNRLMNRKAKITKYLIKTHSFKTRKVLLNMRNYVERTGANERWNDASLTKLENNLQSTFPCIRIGRYVRMCRLSVCHTEGGGGM